MSQWNRQRRNVICGKPKLSFTESGSGLGALSVVVVLLRAVSTHESGDTYLEDRTWFKLSSCRKWTCVEPVLHACGIAYVHGPCHASALKVLPWKENSTFTWMSMLQLRTKKQPQISFKHENLDTPISHEERESTRAIYSRYRHDWAEH